MLVHPTQAVVIFGNISMALGTLAIHFQRSSYESLEYSYICRIDVAIGQGLGCLWLTAIAGNCNLFGSIALIASQPGHQPLQ